MLLNGTGISDTAAHSVIERENSLEQTYDVFLEHPFIGRSLGGVSSAIADLQGERVESFEESKDFEGMNVFAEALAASGVFGIIPFVCFLVVSFHKPWQLARVAPAFDSVLLRALLRSLFFAWIVLQFNQNMLRPYLWTHLALLASVYAVASNYRRSGE
jgi:O-antigen ligase